MGRHECAATRGRPAEIAAVQRLEPRQLLAAFVGIGFDRTATTMDAVIVEGSATASGLASGQVFTSTSAGRSTGAEQNKSGEAMTRAPRPGPRTSRKKPPQPLIAPP